MLQTDKLIKTAFLILIILFCLSMINLFLLRFKSGDIYPAYSSFNSDPMGTKALFDSLVSLKGPDIARSFIPSEQIKNAKDTCIIIAGLRSGQRLFISQKEYENIERLTHEGCRLIIALTPVVDRQSKSLSQKSDAQTPESPKHAESRKETPKKEIPKKETGEPEDLQQVDLFEKLGITVRRTHFKEKGLLASPSTDLNTPHSFCATPWQQAFWFESGSSFWKTIYAINSEEPVIIEKKKLSGSGSLVLLADSYIFSNESLKANSNSELLIWLMGDKKRILFDEYHLGVQKNPGISTLFKKYRLYGPAGLFFIFIILVLWRQSSVLIAPDEHEELSALNHSKNKTVQIKDHMSGLTSLLKQHIPKKQLIPQCIEAWKNAFVMDNQASQKYAEQYKIIHEAFDSRAQKNAPSAKTSEVDMYIRICHLLSEKEKT
ncbi:MAG: hypothetical protein KKE62_18325 [Proteobacteria bacterium]|nr:hypothetical protein [Pseudomonadota bacterium]MBU1389230.1 hypothetical protein [Pseudomonadota bacterium]MBU1544794.1 hypothetical protein [Pseudomonadota bacterium]MBU2430637.1 hypothetical protein [Pseudomonadota bacterium]MBU2481898.1 hypothetical protein [Pseudomonadota bacterium]